jgi:hypothetical protein
MNVVFEPDRFVRAFRFFSELFSRLSLEHLFAVTINFGFIRGLQEFSVVFSRAFRRRSAAATCSIDGVRINRDALEHGLVASPMFLSNAYLQVSFLLLALRAACFKIWHSPSFRFLCINVSEWCNDERLWIDKEKYARSCVGDSRASSYTMFKETVK